MYINSYISNFINLPIQFIMIIWSIFYLKHVKISFKTAWIGIILIFIPSVILYNYLYWFGIVYLIFAVILFFTKYTKDKLTVFYVGTVLLLAIIADHLATLLVSLITLDYDLTRIILRIIIFIFILIFEVYIFRFINDFYFKTLNLSTKVKWLFNVSVLLTLFVFYFNIFKLFKYNSIEGLRINTIFFISFFLILVILIGISIFIFVKEEKLKTREKVMENFNSYVATLEQVNKDMQKFRHDYMNILLSMKGYIDERDITGLEAYFKKYIIKVEYQTLMSTYIIGNLENLYCKSLKGLLFNKSNRALELGLHITIEIPHPIHDLSFDIMNLNRIVAILFDNAIENCLEDDKKEIAVAILREDGKYTLFTIRNKISDKKININEIFEGNFTTKEKHQGIGLTTVKQIISKSTGATLNSWIEDDWFCIEIIIMED